MRLRWKIAIPAALVVLLLAAGFIGINSVISNTPWIKSQIVSAIEKNTGRKASIGDISIHLFPIPQIQASDIHLANIEGDPNDMASIEKLNLQIAFWPLLSHDVVLKNITLTRPDIYLTRFADGQENWVFTHPNTSTAAPTTSSKSPWKITAPNVTIIGGSFHYRDAITHSHNDVTFDEIALSHLDGARPAIAIKGNYIDSLFTLNGNIGRLYPLSDNFPLDLTLNLAREGSSLLQARINGALSHLTAQPSYNLMMTAQLGDASRLNALAPTLKLPKTDTITLAGNVVGTGNAPSVHSLHLHTGYIDTSNWLANSSIHHLTIDDDALTHPLLISGEGTSAKGQIQISGSAGTLELLSNNAAIRKDIPVNLSTKITQDNRDIVLAQIQGTLANLLGVPDYKLNVSAHLDDPTMLSNIIPQLQIARADPITFESNVTGQGNNPIFNTLHLRTGYIDLTHWMAKSYITRFALDGNSLTSPLIIGADGHFNGNRIQTNGQFGTLQILSHYTLPENVPVDLATTEGTTSVHLRGYVGRNHSSLDLDGGLAQLPLKQENSTLNNIHISSHAELGAVDRLIAHHKPLQVLRSLRLRGHTHIQSIVWQGAVWKDVSAPISSNNGLIELSPVTAFGAGSQQEQKLFVTYDVSKEIPYLHFSTDSFYVPLSAVRNMLHITPRIQGYAQIVGALGSQGNNNNELADHADGHLGVSVVNGQISRQLLVNLFKKDLPFGAEIPESCMGIHFKVHNGIGTIDGLGAQLLSFRVMGLGRVNLLTHVLAMELEGQLGLFQAAPVRQDIQLTGHWENPQTLLIPTNYQQSFQPLTTAQYCSILLKITREGHGGPNPDLDKTTTRGIMNNKIAKGLGVKSKDVETGEEALGLGLSILGATNGDSNAEAGANMLNSFGL